jgi:Arc/MetJ-type ribon-helix-helix transcriptional regulator
MTEEQETKIKTSISLSPYLYDWMISLVKKQFASNSDVITTALSEMKGRMEEREKLAVCEPINKHTKSGEDFELLLLQLLDEHNELIEEVNELRRKHRDNPGNNVRKINFR